MIRKRISGTLTALLCSLGLSILALPSTAATPVTLQLQSAGSTVPKAGPVGGDSLTSDELDPAMTAGDADSGNGSDSLGPQPVVNRGITRGRQGGSTLARSARAKSNPQLVTSFDGLNFHDQRFANGGNQFSVEPPDQGLCAGNGFVVESVNNVLAIYDRAGNKLVGPVDLNTFYG